MKRILSLIFCQLIFLILPSLTVAQQLPQPDHIIIVIEENHAYDQIIGNSSAPYINSLAQDTLGALFTNFYAETHPSQPNYLWFFSGDNQGVTDDNVPNDTPFTTPNLGASLLQASLTFGGYSEDLPYVGFQGSSSGSYKRKHNPWVNWQGNNTNGIPASLNMPLTYLPANLDSLPKVSFVIPNQDNDMHSGSIAQGDAWLQTNLDGYIQWAKTHNSLFILTFDEDNGGSGNQIVTIMVGQMIMQGQYGQHLNHLNLLRTIEDMYDLPPAGSSADSTSITNCWNVVLPVELVSFNAAINGQTILLNWKTGSELNNKGFEVQRSDNNADWKSLAFVKGNGTTSKQHSYSYNDQIGSSPSYYYRLKQIDFDGNFNISQTINIVNIISSVNFKLKQNYPNPFNPSTNISFYLPKESRVKIKIFDITGKQVAEILNDNLEAGTHSVLFNPDGKLSSGIYIYSLITPKKVINRKMIYLK